MEKNITSTALQVGLLKYWEPLMKLSLMFLTETGVLLNKLPAIHYRSIHKIKRMFKSTQSNNSKIKRARTLLFIKALVTIIK